MGILLSLINGQQSGILSFVNKGLFCSIISDYYLIVRVITHCFVLHSPLPLGIDKEVNTHIIESESF